MEMMKCFLFVGVSLFYLILQSICMCIIFEIKRFLFVELFFIIALKPNNQSKKEQNFKLNVRLFVVVTT